jgi:hypothetical protein
MQTLYLWLVQQVTQITAECFGFKYLAQVTSFHWTASLLSEVLK